LTARLYGAFVEAVFHKQASPCCARYGILGGSDNEIREAEEKSKVFFFLCAEIDHLFQSRHWAPG